MTQSLRVWCMRIKFGERDYLLSARCCAASLLGDGKIFFFNEVQVPGGKLLMHLLKCWTADSMSSPIPGFRV